MNFTTMNSALVVSALSLMCLGCGSGNIETKATAPILETANTVPDTTAQVATVSLVAPTAKQPATNSTTPGPDIAQVTPSAARYTGEIGTVESDRAFSNFLFENDGEWVELDVFITENNEHYGEDWLTLCAEATTGDDCTAVFINAGENDFNALLLSEVDGGQKLSGYWVVRANPGMHQGFLSITLEPIP